MEAYNQPSEPKNADAPYFSVQEVAYLLKVSVKTVRRRINKDGFPHSRPGGRVILISREDLAHYYEADRVAPTPIRRRATRRSDAPLAA
ncbi:helix-turn-helix domain-containing protein [Streptomyces sp. NBC_01353]|uniref:helix-turn-helix domain-containing protein n=1 Tax=Streptomyces sp. NBC_01353 TaxID=2903835 RepID=UPI002E30D391|nr:helix-turn-helix domain-containing protein [Streptomyces sp. NBC_01353]